MNVPKFLILAFSLLATILSLTTSPSVVSFGGQGYFVLALAAAPGVLALYGIATKHVPRAAAGIALACFLILAMKTTEAPYDNIMMAAAAGMIASIAALIKPQRRAQLATNS